MPDYRYECRECNEEWREVHTIADRDNCRACPSCGGKGKKAFEAPQTRIFRARFFEGIASGPVFVESASQLNRICNENGCYVEEDDRRKQKAYYETRGMVEEGKRVCR